jgi:hypothetical protein
MAAHCCEQEGFRYKQKYYAVEFSKDSVTLGILPRCSVKLALSPKLSRIKAAVAAGFDGRTTPV